MSEYFDPLKAKRELRENQWIVLVAVEQVGRDGWPVTAREASSYAGRSLNCTHTRLKELERLGLLESNPRFRGGWRITDRGHAVTNA